MGKSTQVIEKWIPDDQQFWEQTGKKIANRNLWISIPCLLLGFCVWMLFSIISIHLNEIGFNFSKEQLYLLVAIPSVSGALFRVPYSFVIPIFGGRRWTTFSTIILVLPCIWLGYAVQDLNTPYIIFIIIALLCGLGGANFASSMANISFFYPKSQQGGALGLNGGLGNMGVSVIQLVAALIIFVPALIGDGQQLANGNTIWIQNAAFIWVPFLIIFSVCALVGMNDLSTSKASFKEQAVVLKDGTMWMLSLLYLATFGSFIGFSAGFGILSKTQFPNVDISLLVFAGPLVGAIGRPLGGMLSDKFNGIRMTLVNYLLMIIFVIGAFIMLPGIMSTDGNFLGFYVPFLLLFFTAGFGSGSTYQMIAVVFRQHIFSDSIKAGATNEAANKHAVTMTAAALGFISAIGAMGGFIIPQLFSISTTLFGTASYALIAFLIFYIVCALITKLNYKAQ